MNRLRTLGAFVVAGVVVGLVWTGVAVAAPGACADILPLSSVSKGDIGEGWTVVEGTDPQPFDAEVLGVAHDLVAPGRDVIIVRISGATVDAGGGVWAGMSGSPVYIGGELAGALAYGFSFGATDIAGLTPAEDMSHLNGLAVSPRVPGAYQAVALRGSLRGGEDRRGAPEVGGSRPPEASGHRLRRGDRALPAMRKLPFFKKYRPTMKFTSGASASRESLRDS